MLIPTYIQLAGTRSSGEIIQAQHVNVLNDQDQINWNNWYNYLNNTGIEGQYIKDGSITSRKMAPSFAEVLPSNNQAVSNIGLSNTSGNFISPYFGNFTIVMERPNQLIEIDQIRCQFGMSFYISQTGTTAVLKRPFANLELWDLQNNLMISSFSFNGGNNFYAPTSSFSVVRVGGADLITYINDFMVQEGVWFTNYRPISLTQMSIPFAFKVTIGNAGNSPSTNQNATGLGAGTFGAVCVPSLKYKLWNKAN